MSNCIATIIKDEQLYLDEWISYHLNLGVDYIFIFEDIGSKSHASIVEKYKDHVKLYLLKDVLSDADIKNLYEWKKTNADKNLHVFRLRKVLKFLKDNHSDFDWCFIIDIDEFITLETSNNLNSLLDTYKSYDALILSWECYGANGLLSTPDYRNKGVIDIYTKKIDMNNMHTKPWTYTKTCYNWKNYKEQFFKGPHQPTEVCHCCRPNLSEDRDAVIYDKIYLRHYITRSWEEYIWKKKERGYMYGRNRSFSLFFKLNNDLDMYKDSLLEKTSNKTLVILPYHQTHAQGNELRLALNCWKKFCTFNYEFVVIGDYDESLIKEFDWVKFIHVDPVKRVNGQYIPHLDIQHKMEIAYDNYRLKYPGFIYMVDDNYAIKPFSLEDILTIHYHQDSFVGVENLPVTYWKHDKWKTRQLCDNNKFGHINYTTHFPCYFNFERFKKLWDKFDMRHNSYVPEDVYFNSYQHIDPILDNEIRLGIWSKEIFNNKFQDALNNPNIKFVCNSPEGWSTDLEEALWSIIIE